MATVAAADRPMTVRNGIPTTVRPARANDDGQAGEHDGPAGSGGGDTHGLELGFPAGQFGSIAGQDEHRVVDADGQADHQGQAGCGG